LQRYSEQAGQVVHDCWQSAAFTVLPVAQHRQLILAVTLIMYLNANKLISCEKFSSSAGETVQAPVLSD